MRNAPPLIVLGGVLAVGGLAAALMRLAFFSSRHGYDDCIEPDDTPFRRP